MSRLLPSRRALLAASVAATAACGSQTPQDSSSSNPQTSAAPSSTPAPTASSAPSSTSATPSAAEGRLDVATGLDTPWSVAWLPNGGALVSQRDDAKVVRITPKGDGYELSPMGHVPGVQHGGEGGLLGLVGHPTQEGAVFAYRTTPEGNRVDLFTISTGEWSAQRQIGPTMPFASNHNGGRLAIGPDGKLYVGTGDAARPAAAQERENPAGKILRLNLDGSTPADNPYQTPIWSWGHRNVQGLAWTKDGRMWASEFGASTDDELNFIEMGRNYGWPNVKDDLNGGSVPAPVKNWPDVSVASPSGIAISGNHCFVACLRGQRLYRVTLPAKGEEAAAKGNAPTQQVLELGARLRDVTVTPDGKAVWVVTNEGDRSRIVQIPIADLTK